MSLVILGIGVPGSGKTTVLKPLAERISADYICPDEIRAELSGGDATDHSHEEEVWDITRARALQAIEGSRTVVVDATFTRPEHRREFIEVVRAGGATHVIGAYANVTPETAHTRNFSRPRVVPLHVLNRRLELLANDPPTLTDGFDAIIPLEELSERFG